MSFIKKIRIKNFKNLEDVEIDVKPLTFLFGPNGSGKSSFIKAMMFLQKNLYPYNSRETIYKVSEDIDLMSYEDIVFQNDIKRDIVYSIDMEGTYDFPSEKIFSKEYFDPENKEFSFMYINGDETKYNWSRKKEDKYTENNFYLENFLNSNPFNFFKENKNYFSGTLPIVGKTAYNINYTENFNYTFDISFTHNPLGFNLKSVKITDNNNKYSVEIEVIEVLIYKGKIVYKFNDLVHFNQKKGIYSEYERWLSLIRNDDPELACNDPYDDWDYYTWFRINKFPCVYDVIKDAKIMRSFNIELDDLLPVHYDMFKFIYFSHLIVPIILDDFLIFKHLPITRELPKSSYSLVNNYFMKNDYYDLLNRIFTDQYDTPRTKAIYESGIEKNKNFIEEFESINIMKIFLAWSDNRVYYGVNYYFHINRWLIAFGFDPMLIKKIYNTGFILFKGQYNNLYNFTSCSSGLIQLLPIILYAWYPRKSEMKINFSEIITNESDKTSFNNNDFRTLFIEQPELHLHPKLQSNLAYLFRSLVSKKESCFIETHSEHLIRKIQVLIANGELDRDKVSVMYFDNSEGATKIQKMEIDKNGLFEKDWPDGFFDDSINLTMELYDALRKNKN